MKKLLLITLILNLFCAFSFAQQINQSANWPNNQWALSGSYDASYLYEDPTTSSSGSFSFDDNLAGGASVNNVAAESPVIDLNAAFTANETEITVNFPYVFNIYQTETLNLQYWDSNTSQWENWGNALDENSNSTVNFCNGSSTNYTSEGLDISTFTSGQLTDFKYRIHFNDNTSFGWGFCISSPTIVSSIPPACPNVDSVIQLAILMPTSADINWIAGGSETLWEVVVQLILKELLHQELIQQVIFLIQLVYHQRRIIVCT